MGRKMDIRSITTKELEETEAYWYKKEDACLASSFLFPYTPIQEDIPNVVAIAVNTVMTMLMIFPQTDLFMVISFEL